MTKHAHSQEQAAQEQAAHEQESTFESSPSAPSIPADRDHWVAKTQLDQWELTLRGIKAAFPDPAHQEILSQRTRVNAELREIIFLPWENPPGKAGGVFPVADMLPEALRNAGERVTVLSPFHVGLGGDPNAENPTKLAQDLALVAKLTNVGDAVEIPRNKQTGPDVTGPVDVYCKVAEVNVPFFVGSPTDSAVVPTEVIKLTTFEGKEWYLFRAPTFFTADGGANLSDPYFYSRPGWGDLTHPSLTRDALFAAAAVPRILKELGKTKDIVCHFNDWQFSGVALTVLEALLDGTLESATTVATLHNVYDENAQGHSLAAITLRTDSSLWPGYSPLHRERDTFLSRFLPLSLSPITAVSSPFSLDLRNDPQQCTNLGPHLQDIFAQHDIVGIGHGPFVDTKGLVFSEEVLFAAAEGDFLPIYREKARYRSELIQVIANLPKEAKVGGLDLVGQDILEHGDVTIGGPTGTPIFLMGGRLEPNQKGFDVLASAIRQIRPGTAKFIFSPMNSDRRNQPYMEFLFELAEQRPGDVIVLPKGLPRAEFMRCKRGASYDLFASLFEPYGAVSEAYVNGCPVVARATGGLQSQVIDLNRDPANATGFLFIEPVSLSNEQLAQEWKIIQDAKDPRDQYFYSPKNRAHSELYRSIVGALAQTIPEAARLYRDAPLQYAKLLANVGRYAQTLSWGKPVKLYQKVYDLGGSSWERLREE